MNTVFEIIWQRNITKMNTGVLIQFEKKMFHYCSKQRNAQNRLMTFQILKSFTPLHTIYCLTDAVISLFSCLAARIFKQL
jgi:hypothetical protein